MLEPPTRPHEHIMQLRRDQRLGRGNPSNRPRPIIPTYMPGPLWDRHQRARQGTDLLAQPANAVYPPSPCAPARVGHAAAASPTRQPPPVSRVVSQIQNAGTSASTSRTKNMAVPRPRCSDPPKPP